MVALILLAAGATRPTEATVVPPLMLLFIILGNMGLGGEQVAVVVALALGVNPILDMFETMNNVTGDLVCTYVVAGSEDLLAGEPGEG